MEKTPASEPEVPQYAACPYCTMRIKVGDAACPHCRKPLPPPGAEAGTPPIRRPQHAVGRPRNAGFRDRYGKWIMAAVPVVLALVVLLLFYQRWVGVRITVSPNPSLPVKASLEKKGGLVLVLGSVTNEGEDVPDLSLKSIGVMVEFVYRDGHRQKKRVFPKTAFRGEGALLRGETGAFEIAASKEGLEEVVLRSEVVNLNVSPGRELIPPGGGWRVVPDGK